MVILSYKQALAKSCQAIEHETAIMHYQKLQGSQVQILWSVDHKKSINLQYVINQGRNGTLHVGMQFQSESREVQ